MLILMNTCGKHGKFNKEFLKRRENVDQTKLFKNMYEISQSTTGRDYRHDWNLMSLVTGTESKATAS